VRFHVLLVCMTTMAAAAAAARRPLGAPPTSLPGALQFRLRGGGGEEKTGSQGTIRCSRLRGGGGEEKTRSQRRREARRLRKKLEGGGSGGGGEGGGGGGGEHKPASAMARLNAASSMRWQEKRVTVLSWETNVRLLSDEDIGITEFVKPKRKGTGGILKMGWSDFRVQEIRQRDGQPVVLSHTRQPGDPPPGRGSPILSFVLAKAGYDTVSAVSHLSQYARIPRDRFKHAGIKDKSAVTVQEITVQLDSSQWQNQVYKLLNASASFPRIIVGNPEFVRGHLQACPRTISSKPWTLFAQTSLGNPA
jgi:hypothetical protein